LCGSTPIITAAISHFFIILEAPQAAADTPVQSPTASNQPVSNAA
jgi:hypothetical protein